MKKLLLLSMLSISLFASSGKELFEQKCTSCHSINQPSSFEEAKKQIAPPIGNVLFHLDGHFKTSEEIKNHINEFVMNPTMDKAICNSVKRFGLMPSQKGVVTKEELNKISQFLTEVITYSKNSHSQNKGCGGA